MNCNICNKPIEPGSQFCSGCGNRINTPQQSNQQTVKVVIQRLKRFTGCLATFKVLVDDYEVGVLKNNSSIGVMLTPGMHRLTFKNKLGCTPYNLNVPACNLLHVQVGVDDWGQFQLYGIEGK